jgi:hypothetical protein
VLQDRQQRALDMWALTKFAECGGGHVRLGGLRAAVTILNPSDGAVPSLRDGMGRRFHFPGALKAA